MTTLETKDSRSTLVDVKDIDRAQARPPLASPFSASFDPNTPTPQTPPESVFASATVVARNDPGPILGPESWVGSLSMSLGHLATQFAQASQAMATIPARNGAPQSESLVIMQQAQMRLEEDLDSLKEQIAHLREQGRRTEKAPARDSVSDSADGFEERLKAVETKLAEFAETIRLDQSRLYARLLNSTVTSNKIAITPLVMANGKTPHNFPATRGEFEHLTKERYEHLLKSYGLSVQGDTAAKRQAVREFIGLSPAKS